MLLLLLLSFRESSNPISCSLERIYPRSFSRMLWIFQSVTYFWSWEHLLRYCTTHCIIIVKLFIILGIVHKLVHYSFVLIMKKTKLQSQSESWLPKSWSICDLTFKERLNFTLPKLVTIYNRAITEMHPGFRNSGFFGLLLPELLHAGGTTGFPVLPIM